MSSGDEHESNNPPWYAPDRPGGKFNASGVPNRLFQHPVIQQRKIYLSHAVQPGVVFFTLVAPAPALLGNQVVKILHTDKEEMAIYERLLPELHRLNNHTIPGEITRTGHPLLIMPRLNNINNLYKRERWTPRRLMDAILQVVEGVEYLHGKHIAHMDLHPDNLVVGTRQTAAEHERVVENRIYIIDFDQSRQFTLGPGVQRAITLPDTVHDPPNGLTSFDPYSWDVYCMGRTLHQVVEEYVTDRTCIRVVRRLTGSLRSTFGGWLVTNGSEAVLAYAAAVPPHVWRCGF
ncbi:hypothetical protein TRAPUB_465 [Trametes pubescens]|uniref:Protein kinase domain-containing protein n=1 Tax=Trametes pubescens TaxID=154538 RepID=A0A1M2VM14_TRAPU|nr:hypothetical protein TRAPUB_465 [Trametes pubescens]